MTMAADGLALKAALDADHAPDGMPATAAVAPMAPIQVPPAATEPAPPTERTVTCPTCAHVAPWTAEADPDASVITCDQCKQRIAFGVQVADCRVIIHPDDARFLVFEFVCRVPGNEKSFNVACDVPYARDLALSILRKRTAV